MRNVLLFNENWKFAKTSELVTSIDEFMGESITLPHTWNALDGQDGGNDYWRGTAMYAKAFKKADIPMESENDRVILSLKGAAMTSEVYLNGTKLCHHEGGYATFRADLTDFLKEDNLLLVTVDNGENNRVYPQNADFTFYGGIYRNVELITVSANHFELIKDGTTGMKVTPKVTIQGERAEASVLFEAWCQGGERVVFSMDQKEVEAPLLDGYAKAMIKLEDAHLWQGIKDPYLYEVKASLISNNEISDEVVSRVGLRTIASDPDKGFLLNGKEYPLRGVSRHQDSYEIGCALTDAEHKRDMEMIREIGANTIRLAHYQHADEFYDLCDEYGMVVWAEIPYITKHMPEGRQNTIDQMRELITQCYHHPSIVCWGLSNEITASGTVTEDLLENHRILNDLCHKMDETRPTAMAHAFMLETDSALIPIADLASYNLYFGWYLGELSENDAFFDDYHKAYPDRVIGFSEYGADANPRLHAAKPEKGDYSEEYQCLYHEYMLNCIEKRPYLWATHVWNMFDFAADGREEGGEHGKNQKGLVTIDRRIKKDAFYLYKAYWNKTEAFAHICGRRYIDRTENETEIKVYSNCRQVSLYVDGDFFAKQEGNRIFIFKLPITGKHTISVKASGGIAKSQEVFDEITIQKVDKANESYAIAKNEGGVINWFDAEGIKDGFYSIKDTFGDLMANPESGKIVGGLMQKMVESRGDVAKSANENAALQKMLAKMSFASLLKQAGDAVSPEQIHKLNAILQKIPKNQD